MNDLLGFVKRDPAAPPGFFACEAAGLTWLAEAISHGGARVVVPTEEVRHDATHISLPRVPTSRASEAAAREFGAALARTHAAGAEHHGAMPPGTPQIPSAAGGFIGPLPMPAAPIGLSWSAFFAEYRILAFTRQARDRGALTSSGARVIEEVAERLSGGSIEVPIEPVARLHGDLWSGNVLWSPHGAVLIDPSAHGGHRESDLAMLGLFGVPHGEHILAGYQSVSPLADAWQSRVGLHQLYPLLVHAVLFAGPYGAQALETARQYL